MSNEKFNDLMNSVNENYKNLCESNGRPFETEIRSLQVKAVVQAISDMIAGEEVPVISGRRNMKLTVIHFPVSGSQCLATCKHSSGGVRIGSGACKACYNCHAYGVDEDIIICSEYTREEARAQEILKGTLNSWNVRREL